MRQVRGLMLVISLAACNPIVAATSVVHETYGAATDLRSLSTQGDRHAGRSPAQGGSSGLAGARHQPYRRVLPTGCDGARGRRPDGDLQPARRLYGSPGRPRGEAGGDLFRAVQNARRSVSGRDRATGRRASGHMAGV
jgi:hypothetical protein